MSNKIISGVIATTALAFGLTFNAQAEPSTPASGNCDMNPMMMQGMGMMGDPKMHIAHRLDAFKSSLKITAQQEPLWTAFADEAKAEAAKGMETMHANLQKNMSAPERMQAMMTLMQQRAQAMGAVSGKFKALYEALTPEQKTVADQRADLFSGGMRPMMQHRRPPG